MSDYMSLIERLEKATEDRELDAAVYEACVGEVWNDFLSGPWAADGKSRVPFYTSSIDAALSLVPEGWRYGIEQAGRFDSNDLTEAWCWPHEDGFEPDWMNGDEGYRSCPNSARAAHKETAIALCIAALKAHSLIGKKEG